MNILTLESSSLSASVCITEDTKLLAQSFQNCGLTHSATLLPMIDHIMTSAQMTLADIDVIACVTGPGSFTGVRIGVSTAKGIADAKNIPCVGVSSLAGAAWNVAPLTDRLIPVIADEYVDREFGSGCVKITPAHDFNDFEVGKRHNLEMLNILT